ncbi:MAG: hypothetical protein HY290_14370 [Planctomycetia bacterium]|nr:hypothetical protein [Planctomycetia bacterium]
MKTLKTLAVFGTVISLTAAVGVAKDEPYLKADHKMLGHQAQSSQQHAQDQAQTLYYYSQSQQPIPKQEAKDLVAGIRKDLAASEKALAALKAEFAKNKEAVDLIESIKKHHAKAHEQCGMAEEACAKEASDKVVIGDCCSEMWHHLEAAKTETQKLLKLLKIEKLEPPKKVGAKK